MHIEKNLKERREAHPVLEFKLVNVADHMFVTGLIFSGFQEKLPRVYLRLQSLTDQSWKAVPRSRSDVGQSAKKGEKAILKLRPLDTNNIAYFTESVRYRPLSQRRTSLIFI